MTDPGQDAVLTHIRVDKIDAAGARAKAAICRAQAADPAHFLTGLTSEQSIENAEFWDHVAELVASGQADWMAV